MSRTFTLQYSNLDSTVQKKMLHHYMKSNPEIAAEYLSISLEEDNWNAYEKVITSHPELKDKFVEYANSDLFRNVVFKRIFSNSKLLEKLSIPAREADIYVEKMNTQKEPTLNFAYIWLEERVQVYRVDNRYYISMLVIDEKFDRLMFTNDADPSRIELYKLPWDTTKSLDTYELEALIAMQYRDYLAEKEIFK